MVFPQGIDSVAEVCRCTVEIGGFASVFRTMAAPGKDVTFAVESRKLRIDVHQALVCMKLVHSSCNLYKGVDELIGISSGKGSSKDPKFLVKSKPRCFPAMCLLVV